MLRKLVRNGYKRKENFHFLLSNDQILSSDDIPTFVAKQQASYLGHLARQSNKCLTKRLLFIDNKRTKPGRPVETLEDKAMKFNNITKDQFYTSALKRERHDHPTEFDRL